MHKRFHPKRMEMLPAQILDAKGQSTGTFGEDKPTAVIRPKGA